MSQTQKSIAVLTSGGDAPGMNAACHKTDEKICLLSEINYKTIYFKSQQT